MATSGVYVITKTASELITSSLLVLGVIDPIEASSANEIVVGIDALNMLLLQLKSPVNKLHSGDQLWQRETATLTLTSKMIYDLKPTGGDLDIQVPVQVTSVLRRDTDSLDIALDTMSYGDYINITDKTQESVPSLYYYEKRIDTGKLYLNTIPEDTTDTLFITYRQPFEQIVNTTDEIDVEDYMLRMLKYKLAIDLAPVFRSPVTQELLFLAQESTTLAQTFQPVESDVFFQPGLDD